MGIPHGFCGCYRWLIAMTEDWVPGMESDLSVMHSDWAGVGDAGAEVWIADTGVGMSAELISLPLVAVHA